MALFPQEALNPGIRKREVFGWAMYDFANSGYTTVVLTAVFNAYFVGVGRRQRAVGDASPGPRRSRLSSLLVMLTVPALGAWADLRAAKKRLLAVTTAGCVVATAALAPGRPRRRRARRRRRSSVRTSFYSYGEKLIAAFLPELARPEALGRVSGWGWSFGYFGGMLALGLCLAYVLAAQARGEPATSFVPVTMLITAAIFALASIATFVFLRERARPQAARRQRGIGAALRAPAPDLRARAPLPRLQLAARLRGACYQAGIAVVIALAAIYAEQAMGFKQAQTMMLVFLVNITAAARRVRVRLLAGPARPQARARGHARRLDRHVGARGRWRPGRAVLARRPTSPACAWARASRPAARWPALFAPADAARRVLRAVGLRDPAGVDPRPAHLRRGHLGDRRQPPARVPVTGAVLRRRLAAAAADRRRARRRRRRRACRRRSRVEARGGVEPT